MLDALANIRIDGWTYIWFAATTFAFYFFFHGIVELYRVFRGERFGHGLSREPGKTLVRLFWPVIPFLLISLFLFNSFGN